MAITVKYTGAAVYSQPDPNRPPGPFLPVRLRKGGLYYDTIGLVDSGAEGSMFHSQHALALGLSLDPANAKTASGIGGNTPIWLHQIDLAVAGKTITATIAFSPGCPLLYGLLGRSDFFEQFHVGLEQRDRQVLYHKLP